VSVPLVNQHTMRVRRLISSVTWLAQPNFFHIKTQPVRFS